jgi:hypothetical protein
VSNLDPLRNFNRNWTITNPAISKQVPLSLEWNLAFDRIQAKLSWDNDSTLIEDDSIGFKNSSCFNPGCIFWLG